MCSRALVIAKGRATCFTTLWLCVEEWGFKRGQCHCLTSRGLLATSPTSSYLTHLLYMIDAFPDVGFAYILRLYRPFKWQNLAFSSAVPILTCFLQPEVMEVYPPDAGGYAA